MAKIANAVKNAVFTPSAADIAFANTTVQTLDGLVARRVQWEPTDYKKANEGLYALLSDCLAVFTDKFIKADTDGQKALRQDLTDKLKADGVKVQKTTPTLTMFVRYVFGSDRKRAHGYANVLKAAYKDGITAEHLPAYIVEAGGIEEVKRKMVQSSEAKAKREAYEVAKLSVELLLDFNSATPLASVPLSGVTGGYAVLLGRPTPDGMINIVGVLPEAKEDLISVLIAHMAKRKIKDDEAVVELSKEATDLMAASAEAANAPALAAQA